MGLPRKVRRAVPLPRSRQQPSRQQPSRADLWRLTSTTLLLTTVTVPQLISLHSGMGSGCSNVALGGGIRGRQGRRRGACIILAPTVSKRRASDTITLAVVASIPVAGSARQVAMGRVYTQLDVEKDLANWFADGLDMSEEHHQAVARSLKGDVYKMRAIGFLISFFSIGVVVISSISNHQHQRQQH